jgi:hypothetical protein
MVSASASGDSRAATLNHSTESLIQHALNQGASQHCLNEVWTWAGLLSG